MRRYETVWVVNGDLPDEDVKATIDKFTKVITGQGGTLVSVEEWGRRKLAYKIEGAVRGYYVLADFAGLPATVKELERNYRIDDRVIRYLTIKKSDKVDLAALEAEIAAKAKEAARLQSEREAASEAAATAAAAEASAPSTPMEPAESASISIPATEAAEAESAVEPDKEA
jgi:small subunit ribosomal protein S6|uniref:Small ribosomal subunit protein bS6 n=1 Tax=Desulfobacca acetoxidans TaxID=60893 RepID=A0A7C3UYU6_9BACT